MNYKIALSFLQFIFLRWLLKTILQNYDELDEQIKRKGISKRFRGSLRSWSGSPNLKSLRKINEEENSSRVEKVMQFLK